MHNTMIIMHNNMIKRWYTIMKPGLWMHNNDPIGSKQCRPKNRQRRNYWKTHIFCFANTFGFITVCNCVTYTFTIGHRNKTVDSFIFSLVFLVQQFYINHSKTLQAEEVMKRLLASLTHQSIPLGGKKPNFNLSCIHLY